MSKKKSKLPFECPLGKLKDENPERFYDWADENIGEGKMSIVTEVTKKTTGEKFVAKKIYWEEDVKFAEREYKLMMGISERGKDLKDFFGHKAFVKIHEAFLLRKYMVIIMENADGLTILDYVAKKASYTEEDASKLIKQILEGLKHAHALNCVHLDIRPTNIRVRSNGEVKIVDYNSARELANKKAGAVVDVIGDTEFCGPEMLNFDPVSPQSDVWGVAVLTYILLTGISPYYDEDEAKVLQTVVGCKYDKMPGELTTDAHDFIKKVFIRAPENRPTAEAILEHPWLSDSKAGARKGHDLSVIQSDIAETDQRLNDEEAEEYVECSGTLRTYEEEEFESPCEDSEEEEKK